MSLSALRNAKMENKWFISCFTISKPFMLQECSMAPCKTYLFGLSEPTTFAKLNPSTTHSPEVAVFGYQISRMLFWE